MSARKGGSSGGRDHRFGGNWTDAKLEILQKYLAAYATALKNQPFRTEYIDAFAGTGYRTLRERDDDGSLLFPDLAADSPQELLDGSARIALKTEPRFSKYIFIERNRERCEALEGLKGEFPGLAKDIRIQPGEANQEIRALCAENWSSRRAVLFLDPYGMQVEWATIEAIAATRAIDLWILFPLGIGVNRLLVRSGDIPSSWRRRLDLLLGTQDWYPEFYKTEPAPTLFNRDETRVVKASTEVIGGYFNERLTRIFAGVAAKPRVLENSAGCPLYLFCFAVGNPAGTPIALRIASHLIGQR